MIGDRGKAFLEQNFWVITKNHHIESKSGAARFTQYRRVTYYSVCMHTRCDRKINILLIYAYHLKLDTTLNYVIQATS